MLIVFIIIFVGVVAICDFSALFLDEELESILYYSDETPTDVVGDIEAVYADEDENAAEDVGEEEALEPVIAQETTEVTIAAEDDFDSYDMEDDDTIDLDLDMEPDLDLKDEILQQIVQNAEIL